MFKRYYLVILIIGLIFLLVPCSFAFDDNATGNEAAANDFLDNSLSESNDFSIEIHVDAGGSDSNDGSEAKPVATISKAIDISSNHSKIIIHEGIYKENNLNITKSLDIISQGDVIIDAENSSRIFTINTRTEADEVLISGITFINGRAYQGGVIYIRNAITTIDNSKFINNTALTEGGAIYWNAPYGKLTNTVFEDNYARDGAAVSWGGSDSEDIFGIKSDYGQIINCTFENNHIMQDDDACIGISVYADYVNIANSRFVNHKTDFNSSFGVVYLNGDYAVVSNCLFENNTFTMTGALGLDGNFAVAYNNTFINNTMTFNDSFGGAIGIQSENADIYYNTFISNGGKGGVGGAIFINTIETFSFNFINITDNIFKDNFAYYGGGIFATGKSNMLTLQIISNTFDGENAFDGAGIFLTDIYNPVVIENNDFTNLMAFDGAGIYSSHSILQLANNSAENYTSDDYGFIYTDGEIRSQVYLRFNDESGAIGRPTVLTAGLFDDMNNSISTKTITFTCNGEKLSGVKGLNNITHTFNALGSYNISGSFNSPKLNVEDGILTIIKGANLNVSNITNYGRNVGIKVSLTDDDNNVLAGKEIILNLDGANYLLFTDSNGEAKFNKDLDFNTYDFTVTLNEDDYYKMRVSSTITVLSSINASDMTRAYNSAYDFVAALVNKDGSPLSNTDVVLKVNNKDYSVKSDENGIVKLTKLPVGSYIVTVNNPATGDSLNKNLKIVKRITGNANVNMYFGAGKYYKVRVYSDDGKAAGAGQSVSFKINGKTYTKKTDKNGYASFKVTLPAKTYTITATYKGVKVSNKVVVKPVLTAKNLSKKKAKTIKFTAKLVNSKGKALKGKIIKFKFKGKTYKAKTNKNGIATISLKNLKVGKYSIKATYGKSTIKNTIRIKK